jgi:hypothetical protein
VPAIVVVQDRHSPQPGTPADVHSNAAAKHNAATERPDPDQPGMRHRGHVSRITARSRRGGHQVSLDRLLANQPCEYPRHHPKQ